MRRIDWASVLEKAKAHALAWLESLPERPVYARARSEAMLAVLDRPVPEEPTAPERVIDELCAAVEPGLTAMPSGRFFGWVIGGGLPSAVAADWLTSAWDQNGASAEGTPAAAAVEQVAIRWTLELLDLPRGCAAALVTGGQMANTVGLAVARHHVLAAAGWDVEALGLFGAPPVHLVAGADRHDTIDRSLRLLGLGAARLTVVPADAQGRLRADALADLLEPLEGPVIVCAQAGNVNTGAIDPVGEIADAVDRLRARSGGAAWLHLDGAFGLWARASARLRGRVVGAERADSWATDAHKWLNTPFDCGIAITAHPASHRAALGIRADYLPPGSDERVRVPFDWTPELSRRARGFALYAALCELGRRGLGELVERACALARRFAERLGAVPGVTVHNEVVLNQVLVSFGDDARTTEVLRRVREDRTCLVSGTAWRGQAAMRISVSNAFTDEEDVDRSVEAMLRAFREAGG